MTAEQQLRDGNLDAALQELQAKVKQAPADAGHRVFLFQLLVVLGQWERARTQLNVLRDLDPKTIPMVQTYREALRCEVLRAEVWNGSRSPLLFGEPQAWIGGMVQAMALSAQGKVAEAQAMRAQVLEAAPAVAGSLQLAGSDAEQPFAWLADADPRLGPLFEAIVNGKYYWVPATAIGRVEIDAPADLRDVVWLPARLFWSNGGEAVGLLPARYPGSEGAEPALRLGRRTEWQDAGHDEFRGCGQKLLATDAGEHGLLDVRRITFAQP